MLPDGSDVPRSASVRRLYDEIDRLSRDASAPILLEGETGTGKTLLARRIHEISPRARGPFLAVLLSALDDALASSELFGHVAGAFTDARRPRAGSFVSASHGTLFLDEIGKASLAVQRKLLHAIEYGEIRPLGSDRIVAIDARVIAASNVPLSEATARGEFLGDLYSRLEVFRVELPPLRSRRADIPVLVDAYVRTHAPAAGYANSVPLVSDSLMNALRRAPWPHNLRQLNASVHRLLVEAERAETLTLDHCRGPLAYLRELSSECSVPSPEEIGRALIECRDNSTMAARRLGIHRSTLYRRRSRLKDDNASSGAA